MSLDGEKDVVCASQPDFTCSAKCLRLMTAVQEDLSQHIKRAPKTFRTTSEAGTNSSCNFLVFSTASLVV